MRRLAATAALLLATAGPAAATGTIACTSADGAAAWYMGIGTLPVLYVLRAVVETPGSTLTTEDGAETRVLVGQAFEDAETLRVDLTDDNVMEVVASLRLFRASEGSDYASAGTLRVAGEGAWAVACEGP